MDMRRWGPLVFVLLMVLGFATSSAAQTETASLSGRLTDPNGGVVPNAQVELTNIDTNFRTTTTTNGEGLYAFPNVRPGRYRLTITKEGFKQIAKTDIVLSVQDVIALNFALEIGSVNETVTVLGGTPLPGIHAEKGPPKCPWTTRTIIHSLTNRYLNTISCATQIERRRYSVRLCIIRTVCDTLMLRSDCAGGKVD